METRLDRTGVDATANNIIRTARATARFFRKPRQGDLILFSQISSIRNEGRHEQLGRSLPPPAVVAGLFNVVGGVVVGVLGSPGILKHIEQAIEANRRPAPGSKVNHSHNHVLLEQHGYKHPTDPPDPLPNPHDRAFGDQEFRRAASRFKVRPSWAPGVACEAVIRQDRVSPKSLLAAAILVARPCR